MRWRERSLTDTECRYAQVEKEALVIVFGIKKFHEYIFDRRLTIVTDHKPLATILGPKTTLALSRLQRWALILSAYTCSIQFRKS